MQRPTTFIDRAIIPMAIPALGLLLAISGCQSASSTSPSAEQDKGMKQYLRGYDAYQSGYRDAAVRALLAALHENADLITARSLLADIYRNEGQYEAAIAQYEKLAGLDPYDYLNFYYLGVSNQFLGRLQAAVTSYLQSAKLKPDDTKTNMNLGLAYMVLGQSDNALSHAKKATDLSPDSATAWGNYALVLDSSKQHAEAEVAYRRSLDLDPTIAAVQINYAANLIEQQRPREAVMLLEQLPGRQKSVLALRLLGDAYKASDQPDKALQQYSAALAVNPLYYPAMNQSAQVQIETYDKGMRINEQARKEALNMWQKSLQVYPDQPQIRQQMQRWQNVDLFSH
ncbi:MAG: tetratricopeptide repeat protein [Phycisphaerales bacterium]|nr:tetratricopeptide repeat protein [Phycisphaerales bacterium]